MIVSVYVFENYQSLDSIRTADDLIYNLLCAVEESYIVFVWLSLC